MSGDQRKRKRIERKLFGTSGEHAEEQGAAARPPVLLRRGKVLCRNRGTRLDPDETFRRLRKSKLMPNTQPEKDESLLFVQQMIQHFNNKESFVEIDPSGKSIAYMFLGDLDPTDRMRDIIFDIKLCLERLNPTLFNEESSSESQAALTAAFNKFVDIFVPVYARVDNLAPEIVPRTLGAKVKITPDKRKKSKNPNRVENNPEAGLREEFSELDLSDDDSDRDMSPPEISRTTDKVQKQLRF